MHLLSVRTPRLSTTTLCYTRFRESSSHQTTTTVASAAVFDPRFNRIQFRFVVSINFVSDHVLYLFIYLSISNYSLILFFSGLPSLAFCSVFSPECILPRTATPNRVKCGRGTHTGSRAELHTELKLYLNLFMMARTQGSLKLWLDLDNAFPTLARLAEKQLTVMGLRPRCISLERYCK